MTRAVRICALAWGLSLLGHAAPAAAQDPALTVRAEEGFRRFMEMARTGKLGGEVIAANVGIEKTLVRVELVRRAGGGLSFVLTAKRSSDPHPRYFDIAPGEGVSREDTVRVGRALDDAFDADPFTFVSSEGVPGDGPAPSLLAAWSAGGLRAVAGALERRAMALVGIAHTTGCILALALGSLAGVLLLWTSPPHRTPAAGATSRIRAVR